MPSALLREPQSLSDPSRVTDVIRGVTAKVYNK